MIFMSREVKSPFYIKSIGFCKQTDGFVCNGAGVQCTYISAEKKKKVCGIFVSE